MGGTAGDVSYKMATSKDNTDTASATGYTLVEKKVSSASFMADNVIVGKTPTKITFGATVATALAAADTITVTSTGVFTAQTTPFLVTIISGAVECAAAATTTTGALTVTLSDDSGTCAISGAFSMSIAANIAANSATAGAVSYTMATSKDNTATTSAVGYTIVKQVTAASFVANDLRTSATPTLITFGATATTALAAADTITVTSTGIFTVQATAFTVTIVSGSGSTPTCTATGTTTANALTVTLASASGETCAIAADAAFSMTINANIAANSATAGAVSYTMVTPKDDSATASATGYRLVEMKVPAASFVANDLKVGATPTLITFGATVATALAAADTITVTSTGVFTVQATAFTVTIVSGSGSTPTCTATGTTTADALTVTLASASGQTCAIAAAFSMTINANIAANSATAGAVPFTMVTSKDNTATASATGYTLKEFAVDPTFSPASGNVTTGSALTLTSTGAAN